MPSMVSNLSDSADCVWMLSHYPGSQRCFWKLSPSSIPREYGISFCSKVRASSRAKQHSSLNVISGVTFLFRIGLAIIQCCKQTIMMTSDRENILNTLLHPPSALLPASPDVFVEMASALKFKDEDVRKQRTKLEAQSKRQTQARNPLSQGGATTIIPLRPTASNISLPRR